MLWKLSRKSFKNIENALKQCNAIAIISLKMIKKLFEQTKIRTFRNKLDHNVISTDLLVVTILSSGSIVIIIVNNKPLNCR